MLLAEAADISENLRRLYRKMLTDRENRSMYFSQALTVIQQATRDVGDEMESLIDIFYPKYSRYQRQFTTIHWVRGDLCKKLSISPLVWDESLAGKPIIPLLSLESPEYGGEGMTVKQALTLMPRIQDLGFLAVANKMNEKEALLFWSRALDESPMMPVDRFLQMVSYLGDGHSQSLTAIRRMLETMSPAEVLNKLFAEEKVDLDIRTMQPGIAFKGPIYRAWNKLVTPTEVYAEVVSKPRRYLHITEFPIGVFKGVLYNRDRQVVGKLSESVLPYKQEAIFEVEADITNVKCITDVLSIGDDWNIHKLDYVDRISYLNRLELKCPVKTGKPLSSSTDLSHLLESLGEQERLRLTNKGAFKIGGEGGWLILKDAFHIHLLVSAIRKDEEFNTHVRLAAMDGYEMYEVGEMEIPVRPAQQMRQRLARDGVLAGTGWLPVDEYAMVVLLEISAFDLDSLTLKQGKLEYLDESMGYSDVSQLTDLIETID